jgi:hypothetical protein
MKKYWGLLLLVFIIVTFAVTAKAQVTLDYSLPGAQVTSNANNPCTTVINFYYFALFISGILAFGAIVWGGIKYAISAGNPSGQSEGVDWIKGALYGILLLASAYLILNIINPNLTQCSLPGLSPLPTTTPVNGGATGSW